MRGAALALLVFAAYRSWRQRDAGAEPARAVAWSVTPSPATRDSLAAVQRAGAVIAWRAPALVPLAVSATRSPAPDASVRLNVTGAQAVMVDDGSGVRDTVRDASRGVSLLQPTPARAFSVTAGGTRAIAEVAPPDTARAVLVVGRASWESKFAVAALEEAGWRVETRLSVAPGADVRQGATGALSSQRYAAVVVLDSSASSFGALLGTFVRSGGGLVLAAEAADAAPLRALSPGRAAVHEPSATLSFDAAAPLRSLARRPLTALRDDAVILERSGANITAAARREGVGRVVQIAYEDTWRWRMEGGDDGVVAHRAWWTRTVGAAVSALAPAPFTAAGAEGAPYARLVDALGAPSAATTTDGPRRLPTWLLPLLCVILLVEWGSRRTRGAR